jgi:WhiB family transcriptional regulator, redox-sensing transcriptional regulator
MLGRRGITLCVPRLEGDGFIRPFAGQTSRGALRQSCSDSWKGRRTVTALHRDEPQPGPCTKNPERWTTAPDNEAKAICRACPRRWLCAREACELPGAQGLWTGIVLPEAGCCRTFALRQLRSLAERNGYQVRPRDVVPVSA